MKNYSVDIEQDEDGVFVISCESIKACHSYGRTLDEALSNIKEVIELCLDEGENDDFSLRT
jgi:predicted RNase H-like HicB family nuclease